MLKRGVVTLWRRLAFANL